MNINYAKGPRKYVLTPSRRKVGRAVARGSRQAVARGSRQAVATECMKDPTTRKYLIHKIGIELRSEISSMCSDRRNSVLRQSSMDSLQTFTGGKVLDEMQVYTIQYVC